MFESVITKKKKKKEKHILKKYCHIVSLTNYLGYSDEASVMSTERVGQFERFLASRGYVECATAIYNFMEDRMLSFSRSKINI